MKFAFHSHLDRFQDLHVGALPERRLEMGRGASGPAGCHRHGLLVSSPMGRQGALPLDGRDFSSWSRVSGLHSCPFSWMQDSFENGTSAYLLIGRAPCSGAWARSTDRLRDSVRGPSTSPPPCTNAWFWCLGQTVLVLPGLLGHHPWALGWVPCPSCCPQLALGGQFAHHPVWLCCSLASGPCPHHP